MPRTPGSAHMGCVTLDVSPPLSGPVPLWGSGASLEGGWEGIIWALRIVLNRGASLVCIGRQEFRSTRGTSTTASRVRDVPQG